MTDLLCFIILHYLVNLLINILLEATSTIYFHCTRVSFSNHQQLGLSHHLTLRSKGLSQNAYTRSQGKIYYITGFAINFVSSSLVVFPFLYAALLAQNGFLPPPTNQIFSAQNLQIFLINVFCSSNFAPKILPPMINCTIFNTYNLS